MSACPADFALRFRWRMGSVPPPGHYRLGIDLGADGTGTARLTLGYGSDGPTVEVALALGPSDLDALYADLTEAGLWAEDWHEPGRERVKVGGRSWGLVATAAGQTVSVPRNAVAASGASAEPLEAAVRSAVPEAVWAGFWARRAAYRLARR